MSRVVCCGLVTADLFYHCEPPIFWGGKFKSPKNSFALGGGAGISASAISALGGQASVIGRIGQDILGEWVKNKLNERNIDTGLLECVPECSTPNSAIITTPNGERTVFNARSHDLFNIVPDLKNLSNFDAALADTRWPDGAAEVFKAARIQKKPAVLDAEAPVAVAMEAFNLATHIIFSEQGLSDFTGGCDEKALASVAQKTGAWVAVTRGADPVLCCFEGQVSSFSPPKVKATNTLGAGDVWHGAFALSLAKTGNPIDALRFGNIAASLKVAMPDGYPTYDMISEYI